MAPSPPPRRSAPRLDPAPPPRQRSNVTIIPNPPSSDTEPYDWAKESNQ